MEHGFETNPSDIEGASEERHLPDSLYDVYKRFCGACNTKIYRGDSCSECSFRFCFNCFDDHDENMKSRFLHVPEEETRCKKTDLKEEHYCKDWQCKQAICEVCADYHEDHVVVSIAEQAKHCWDEMPKIVKENETRYFQLKKTISKLNAKKDEFVIHGCKLRALIQKRHQDAIKFVEEMSGEHLKKFNFEYNKVFEEFLSEIKILENVQEKIKSLIQVNSHLHLPIADHDILNFHQTFKSLGNAKEENKIFKCTHKSLFLENRDSRMPSLQRSVKLFFGPINTTVDGSVIANKQQVFLIPFYEKINDVVKDFCYDIEHGHLFVLVFREPSYYIVKLSDGDFQKEFLIDSSYTMCKRISLFLNGSILLNYENSLKMISNDLTQYVPLRAELSALNNVSIICASSCKKFIYICCKNLHVFRYNQITDNIDKTEFPKLAAEPHWMCVSENSKYIAFAGKEFVGVYLGLYEEREITKIGETKLHVYGAIAFSSKCLVAYNEMSHFLELYSFGKKRLCLRQVASYHKKNVKTEFLGIRAMTMRSSNSFFYTDSTKVDAIYTMLLDST